MELEVVEVVSGLGLGWHHTSTRDWAPMGGGLIIAGQGTDTGWIAGYGSGHCYSGSAGLVAWDELAVRQGILEWDGIFGGLLNSGGAVIVADQRDNCWVTLGAYIRYYSERFSFTRLRRCVRLVYKLVTVVT
jgi:hypothetical protein